MLYSSGARATFTIVAGVITGITITSGGSGYSSGATLEARDRESQGTGATFTYTIDSSGKITGITIVSGGSGYSDNTDLVITEKGTYSGNFATINGCVTYGVASANLAAYLSTTKGDYSANIASKSSSTGGEKSANLAGDTNTATSEKAVTIASGGCNATADLAVVLQGTFSNASATQSLVIGRRTENNVLRSIAFGDGSSGTASTANRKFHLLSNGAISIAGALTQSATFTDIAKMFENSVVGTEIPVGSLVVIEGRKVRLAKAGDDVKRLSAHSRTYVQLLGDSDFTWSGRYQRDEFGQIIYGQVWDEDENEGEGGYINAPLENSSFDITKEQIPRSQRTTEWTPVAMLGEVFVRVDSTVAAGGYVTASSVEGIGTSGSDGLYCMEVTSAYDETKGYAICLCLVK